MKTFAMSFVALGFVASASAHVTVAPQQSPAGAVQVYKVRIHNGGKSPTASIELRVPEGVVIESVAAVPSARSTTAKTGSRVSAITWTIEVLPGKYVEAAFTAKNPGEAGQLTWIIRERFVDGSVTEYTDKPDAKEKASYTKIVK
jgi:uncharacterized protein YcnI